MHSQRSLAWRGWLEAAVSLLEAAAVEKEVKQTPPARRATKVEARVYFFTKTGPSST